MTTREDVIRMAREAWKGRGAVDSWFDECAPNFERFAALVAAAKQEECAKVCDHEHNRDDLTGDYRYGAGICAAAIRALP